VTLPPLLALLLLLPHRLPLILLRIQPSPPTLHLLR
jgi:hypothetical protein